MKNTSEFLIEKVEFFENEFNADINENNGSTYATISLNVKPDFGDTTEEMDKIWEQVNERFPDQTGYEMGCIFDDGDYSSITFNLSEQN